MSQDFRVNYTSRDGFEHFLSLLSCGARDEIRMPFGQGNQFRFSPAIRVDLPDYGFEAGFATLYE